MTHGSFSECVWSLGSKPGLGAAGCVRRGSAAPHTLRGRERGGKKDKVLHLGNSLKVGKPVNSCSVWSSSELWEQTMPLLWHGKVGTEGWDPQRNNRMWIRTFLWFKKLKPTKYKRVVLRPQTLPQHITNCHIFATETFVIPAGVGPQDKFLIKLVTMSYCVVKLDILGKIRGSNNDTISLLTTTTSLKGTKNVSFFFPLFVCESFVCRRYQCHHTKTHLGQMHPKETLTCSVCSRSFYYLCIVEILRDPVRNSSDKM